MYLEISYTLSLHMEDQPMNIATHLDAASLFFPDKTAIIFEDRSISYSDLADLADRTARGLPGLGIAAGDRVAIFLPNIPEFPIVYYALQKIGAVAVSLNAMLKKDEVRYILKDSGARAVFTTLDLLAEVPKDGLPDMSHAIVVDKTSGSGLHLSDIMASSQASLATMDMDTDAPAAILYTSGTTGFPKGAVLSQANIISNTNAAVFHSKMETRDVLHLFLPLFHCFGQNFILNSGIKVGATLVLHQRFEPGAVLDAMKKHHVTMFFAVPTIYIYLLGMNIPPSELASLRYCFTAAANMPPDVARRWQETYGLVINDGYGLTECSPFASYNHDFQYKPGSIGSPIINVEMKVMDSAGNELPAGTWGELCIKGPNVMKGYWRRPEATAEAIRNGWLHTGDIGIQDEQGYFSIVDRVKDMINSAGNKIYPAEVENVLFQHPAVHEVAVFGMPDPEKGEAVKAAVVLKPGEYIPEAELIAFCRSRMAVFKAPRQVVFVSELPKSPTGKILKRILRDQAQDKK